MSKKCELTGKIPLKGHNVRHANNKTKRNFRLTVSNAGVRSVDKKGSFDEFLKSTKTKYLSLRLKKMKKTILNKTA